MIKALTINYNGGDLAIRNLESLRAQSLPVLLIDNNSTDGSIEKIAVEFPALEVIRNKRNIGFAKAVNQGISQIDEEYILLINPDAELINGVDTIINFMARNNRIGLVGGLVMYPDFTRQPSCRGIPTLKNFPFGRTSSLTKIIPNNPLSQSMLLPELNYKSPQKVPSVCGALMIIRKSAFKDVGGMDNNFFLYVEDIDLCKRLWDEGWEVWFHPGVKCIHHLGESHRDNYAMSRIHHLRSMLYFLHKHYQPNALLSAILQLGAGLSAIYFMSRFMFKGKPRWQFS